MKKITNVITPCLWFDHQAEDAAKHYTSIFKHSKITAISRYPEAGHEVHGRKPGSVMTVEFVLDGTTFTALNGGPLFKFSEAISFQVSCATQKEIDYFWEKLSKGGHKSMCGWLKDKFGLSWQVVPEGMAEIMSNPAKAERGMAAVMKMKKFNLSALKKACAD